MPRIRIAAVAGLTVAGLAVVVPTAQAAPDPCAHPTIVAAPGTLTVGTEGPDVIVGTDGDDRIEAAGGNDVICGRGGNDVLHGMEGNDVIHGEDGNDSLRGHEGNDQLHGGAGDDQLRGDYGRDVLRGGAGADVLRAGFDPDQVYGDDGDDIAHTVDDSADVVDGGAGFDRDSSDAKDLVQNFEGKW